MDSTDVFPISLKNVSLGKTFHQRNSYSEKTLPGRTSRGVKSTSPTWPKPPNACVQDSTLPSPFGSVPTGRGSRGGIPGIAPCPLRTTLSLATGDQVLHFWWLEGWSYWRAGKSQAFSLVPTDPEAAALCARSTKHVSGCIVWHVGIIEHWQSMGGWDISPVTGWLADSTAFRIIRCLEKMNRLLHHLWGGGQSFE